MRFQPQQLLFAVHFGNTDRLKGYGHYYQPLLFDAEQPTDINLIQLEVTEHHKVLNEWDKEDAEKKYDGYILKDDKGRTYHNQYPRASYGQTSDEGDRRFSRQADTREEFLAIEAEGPKTVYSYHLLEDVIGKIVRGIRDLGAIAESDKRFSQAVEKKAQLETLRDNILKAFAEKFPEYEIIITDRKLFEASELTWPTAEFVRRLPVDKAKLLTPGQIAKELTSFERFEAEYPSGDRLCIEYADGSYYLNRETTKVKTINVVYGEKDMDYAPEPGKEVKPIYYTHQTEYFPRDWVENAVACFIKRLNADKEGYRATNDGMRLEEIAAREADIEGIQQAKASGGNTLGDLVREKLQ